MTLVEGVPLRIDPSEVEEVVVGPEGQLGVLKRLVTHSKGSAVFLGTFQLQVSQGGTFELPHPKGFDEEIYYIIRGQLKVTWEGGEFVANPGDSIFFPPGGSYGIEAIGPDWVEGVWTANPAPLDS
jgi:ethanolamine utilization protein EutQ (cupin superfamily)